MLPKILPTALFSALLSFAAMAGEGPAPKPDQRFDQIDVAVTKFVKQWRRSRAPFEFGRPIEVYEAVEGKAYKLELRGASVRKPTRQNWRGREGRGSRLAPKEFSSVDSGIAGGNLTLVFDPESGESENVSRKAAVHNYEVTTEDGGGKGASFARSYSKSYVRKFKGTEKKNPPAKELDQDDEMDNEVEAPTFGPTASAQIYLYDDEEAFTKRQAKFGARKLLIQAGELIEDEMFFILVKKGS